MPPVDSREPLGRRVVVRRVTDRSGDRTWYSDVVGVLVNAEELALTVRTRDGTEVRVLRRDIHRMKPVPASAADIQALEEIAALGWQASDSRWLGRWLLRAAHGWTGRGNSVLPIGDPGLPVGEALDAVRAWYAERGLPARFQIPLPLRTSLDHLLDAGGWTSYNHSRVLTADLATALLALPERADLPAVILEPEPSADWLTAYHYRGGPLPENARATLTNADRPVFASVRDGGQTIAVARAVVDRGWAGVAAVEVVAEHRRRGLATHVMRALLEWAAGHRATAVYLQVAGENAAALALYGRLGFTEHHRYHYRLAPAENPAVTEGPAVTGSPAETGSPAATDGQPANG